VKEHDKEMNDSSKSPQSTNKGPMIDLLYHQMGHVEKNYLLHYYVGDRFGSIEKRWLGIPMILLSVLVTSTIGLSLVSSFVPPLWFKLSAVGTSLIVSIQASLVTFLNLRDKAQLHHQAADNFYQLLSKCRAFVADPEFNEFSPETLRRHEQQIITRSSLSAEIIRM
jgi:hypothetical protein